MPSRISLRSWLAAFGNPRGLTRTTLKRLPFSRSFASGFLRLLGDRFMCEVFVQLCCSAIFRSPTQVRGDPMFPLLSSLQSLSVLLPCIFRCLSTFQLFTFFFSRSFLAMTALILLSVVSQPACFVFCSHTLSS